MAANSTEPRDADVLRAEAAFRRACLAYIGGAEVEKGDVWQKVIDRTTRSGLSTRAIAELAGCSVSTVSRWADGLTLPPIASRHWIRAKIVEHFDASGAAEEIDAIERVAVVAQPAVDGRAATSVRRPATEPVKAKKKNLAVAGR